MQPSYIFLKNLKALLWNVITKEDATAVPQSLWEGESPTSLNPNTVDLITEKNIYKLKNKSMCSTHLIDQSPF